MYLKKRKKCSEQVVFDISEIPECIEWWGTRKFCDFSAGMSDVFVSIIMEIWICGFHQNLDWRLTTFAVLLLAENTDSPDLEYLLPRRYVYHVTSGIYHSKQYTTIRNV
ncbi:uncharacterized protein LOC126848955 isoform X2 [Cataglyphis hispanica]|uniref:uncharacterized protein LOC126848955 isoform X2 n=1 Tax=Cataglyphis hispanica TaxID=1086592 RepID=UPI00217FEEFE|nr:uncharacterized protein LOC126848955 isoform X2 [Cataglyphis hispanica]